MEPTVIDLFAGVGGLSLGFEMEGFDILLANEFDQSIATAYKENHKSTNVVVGDITSLDLSKVFGEYVNKIDVVIGGPPCQGFSQKGKRKTINDERNFLFKHYVEVVKFVKPKYFVMENVPNLLTAEKGFFLNEIKGLFKGYGYSIRYGVLNAADYGVPQNRRRAIIIGKYLATPPELPLPCKQKVTIWDAISEFEQEYRNSPKSDYEKKMRKGSKILYNHMATKHSALALERLSLIPPNAGKEILPKEHITKSVYSGTWSRMKQNDVAVTITTRFDTPSSGKFTHPFLNRAITVREAARLQSFPDTFKFIGSKMSQMKQVGNAVPPLLARKIARVIMNDIKRDNNE